jgi:hypothetical protein
MKYLQLFEQFINESKTYKKGDKVTIQDGSIKRSGTVVQDGVDSMGRVRVRPDGIPLDISITTSPNDRVYIIE